MKYISYIAFAMMWLLTACNSEEMGMPVGGGADGRVPLQLTADLGDAGISATTRAANNVWTQGDAVGVYAVATGTTTPITDGANVEYTASSSGTNVPLAATNNPIYLPVDYSAVDVYAYYPHQNSVTMNGQFISVTDQTDQTTIDWMITGRTQYTTQGGSTPITRDNPTCQLLFRHALCKLQFNLKGEGITAQEFTDYNATITIGAGLYTQGYLNLWTGALSMMSANTTTITPLKMASPATNYDMSFEAIVLPQTTTGDITVTIRLGGTPHADYTFTIPAGTFSPGNKYVYSVTVKNKVVTVTSTITDWTTGVEQTIDTAYI